MNAVESIGLSAPSLGDQILDVFPSGSYALSALLRLLDIVPSDTVPTAAVECRLQPRLLINPEFVDRHAETPEKLLMLVMHELHHVLLGHTTLFPRVTPVQNFVFDAVINGVICRMFPSTEHTAFLSDFYSDSSFPECLLRPPPGWPRRSSLAPAVAALPERPRALVHEVHVALYSSAGASYQEVFDVLPVLLDGQGLDGIPLLGGHAPENGVDGASEQVGGLEHRSPVMFDILRQVVEQWPQPPDPIRGRSLADVLNVKAVTARRVPSNRSVLRGLIRKVAGLHGSGRVMRLASDTQSTVTPIPTLSRRSLVLRALGTEPLLHPGHLPWLHRMPAGERVHVYLDVSGSMDAILGALYGAVLDNQAYLHPAVHLFSTKVADVGLAELRQGVCHSTGGTDIACVAAHMAKHRVRRALIVTDGWVGTPRGQHLRTLMETRLAVAYMGSNTNTNDLRAVTNHTASLTV